MISHAIEIRGIEVQINEPLNFDKTEFSIVQDKDYFYREFRFAGNAEATQFQFDWINHENIFNQLLSEFKQLGANAEAYYILYIDGNLSQRLRVDFATAQTDNLTYFDCQCVVENKLKILENNKALKIDLLSQKGYDNDIYDSLDLRSIYASPLGIARKSIFDTNKKINKITGYHPNYNYWNFGNSSSLYEINDTLSWLTPYEQDANWRPHILKRMQLVRFKDNYKDVKVRIKLKGNIMQFKTVEAAELTLYHGLEYEDSQEWFDNAKKILILRPPIETQYAFDIDSLIDLGDIPRGHGIWLSWRGRYEQIRDPGQETYSELRYNEVENLVEITGIASGYGSVFSGNTFRNVIYNSIDKLAKINSAEFNGIDMFDNLVFTGNQLRDLNKKFPITWGDIKSQLKERAIGYEFINDKLIFNKFEHFYQDFEITEMLDVQKIGEFSAKQDIEYHVNSFEYSYKKFQALKENALEGNSGTINGESQWKVNNKFTDSELSITLPFARDKYLIEDTRINALAYNENTSTQNDDTVFICEHGLPTTSVTENMHLLAEFNQQTQIQKFSNQNVFSWVRIGIKVGVTIIINDLRTNESSFLIVDEVDHTLLSGVITVGQTNGINGEGNFLFRFNLNGIDFSLNMPSLNDNYSIRQNIEYIKSFLSPYSTYGGNAMYNLEYKEDGEKIINGIKETDAIALNVPIFTPLEHELLIQDEAYKFDLIRKNPNGYLTVLDAKGSKIKIYIKELHASFLECGMADYRIVGLTKNS